MLSRKHPRPGLEPGTCGLTVCRTVTLDHVLSPNSAPQLSQFDRRKPSTGALVIKFAEQFSSASPVTKFLALEEALTAQHVRVVGSDRGPASYVRDAFVFDNLARCR